MEICLIVRPNERELSQLSALLTKTVQKGASIGFLNGISEREAMEYWHSRLPLLNKNVDLLVARQDGKILGTVQLERCTKSNGKHRAEVQKLCVDPEVRRQGVARKLMQIVETVAIGHNISLLVLDTETYSSAEFLYKGLGWQEAGSIPNFALTPDRKLHSTTLYYKMLDHLTSSQTMTV